MVQETLDLKCRPLWSLAGISTRAEEDILPRQSKKSREVAVGTRQLPAKPEATAAGRGRAAAGGAASSLGKCVASAG